MEMTAYITINGKTFTIGNYSAKNQEECIRLAEKDVTTMLGLQVLPKDENETRPYLLSYVKDESQTYLSDKLKSDGE